MILFFIALLAIVLLLFYGHKTHYYLFALAFIINSALLYAVYNYQLSLWPFEYPFSLALLLAIFFVTFHVIPLAHVLILKSIKHEIIKALLIFLSSFVTLFFLIKLISAFIVHFDMGNIFIKRPMRRKFVLVNPLREIIQWSFFAYIFIESIISSTIAKRQPNKVIESVLGLQILFLIILFVTVMFYNIG